MGLKKRKYDWEAIFSSVSKITNERSKSKRPITVSELARKLGIRKNALAIQLDQTENMTLGQRVRAAAFQSRVDRMPCVDLVGLHLQGAVKQSKYSTFEQDCVAVFAFATRGFPSHKIRVKKMPAQLEEGLLVPSTISSDKMRICQFETIFKETMSRLDDPYNPSIDVERMRQAILSFAAFKNGSEYDVEIFICLKGESIPSFDAIQNSLPELIRNDISAWEKRPEQVIAMVSSIPEIATSGPGHFPLLGETCECLRTIHEDSDPMGELTIAWTPHDLDQALCGRVRICDALANVGVLYGAPHFKVYEMASEETASLSRAVAKKGLKYGDGLHAQNRESSREYVKMLCPVRMRPRYLESIPIEMTGEQDQIQMRKVMFKGKEVECLIAWLPSLQTMLFRSINSKRFVEIYRSSLEEQRMAIANLDHHPFPRCLEIINPNGSITFQKSKESYAFRKGRIVNTSLSIALLLGTYDADSIISQMLSDSDRKKCRAWQEEWHNKVINVLYKKRESIIQRSGWSEKLPAGDQLEQDISKVGISGNRLLRFVLEQSSVNLAKIVLEVSRAHSFDRAIWPDTIDPKVSEQLQKRIHRFWPVVGIRMDYLVTRQASLLRRHLSGKYHEHKLQLPDQQKYQEECHANRASHRIRQDDSEGDEEEYEDNGKCDFDPFADNGN